MPVDALRVICGVDTAGLDRQAGLVARSLSGVLCRGERAVVGVEDALTIGEQVKQHVHGPITTARSRVELSEVSASGDQPSQLSYNDAVVSVPSGGWTTAAVNALLFRVGYSSDVSPNPYWDALLVEYNVATN